jgi:hypothetical protein
MSDTTNITFIGTAHGPGVELASYRDEYQEDFQEVKSADT